MVMSWLFFLRLQGGKTLIHIQHDDFDAGAEIESLRSIGSHIGAVVSFVGSVREFSDHGELVAMELEHYPQMTQKSLESIAAEAKSRWDIEAVKIIHRVGRLLPSDRIVFVGVASQHRSEAFLACEFVIDILKTQAPFWKKECLSSGDQWVDAKQSDEKKSRRWEQ
jgi:molybdopterin synthase catalytic subunit